MAILESVTQLASVIATLTSGLILDATSFTFVFGMISVLTTVAFPYIIFVLEEPSKFKEKAPSQIDPSEAEYDPADFRISSENQAKTDLYKDMKLSGKLKMLFNLGNMKDALLVTFKEREGKARQFIILILTIFFLFTCCKGKIKL